MPKYNLPVSRQVTYKELGVYTVEADDADDVRDKWAESDGVDDVVWAGIPDTVDYDNWDAEGEPKLAVDRPSRNEFPFAKVDCLFCHNRDSGIWRSSNTPECSACGVGWAGHSYDHTPAHIRPKCTGFKLDGQIWLTTLAGPQDHSAGWPEFPPADQCLSCEHFARRNDWGENKSVDPICSECGKRAGEHSGHRADNRHILGHCPGLKINGVIWMEDEAETEGDDNQDDVEVERPEFPDAKSCIFCEHYVRLKDWKDTVHGVKCSECGSRWSDHTSHQDGVPGHHTIRNRCTGFKLDGKIWLDPPKNLYGFFGQDNVLLRGTVMCSEHVADEDTRAMMQAAAESSGVWDGGDAQVIPTPNTLVCLVCAEDNKFSTAA